MRDPIVDEVRKFRMEHTHNFGNDLAAICRDLKRIQDISGYKIVRLASSDAGGKDALNPSEK